MIVENFILHKHLQRAGNALPYWDVGRIDRPARQSGKIKIKCFKIKGKIAYNDISDNCHLNKGFDYVNDY